MARRVFMKKDHIPYLQQKERSRMGSKNSKSRSLMNLLSRHDFVSTILLSLDSASRSFRMIWPRS